MKAITLILMFSLLTLGCQKSDSSKNSPKENLEKPIVSQDETPGGQDTDSAPAEAKPTEQPKKPSAYDADRNSGSGKKPNPKSVFKSGNGGGIDSSGGNLILSTDNQAIEVSAKLPGRIHLALLRLGLQIDSTDKLSFEKMHGKGSFKVVREFTEAKGKNGLNAYELFQKQMVNFYFPSEACKGDHTDRDGSATWKTERPLICISRDALRKLSPESISKDALALGIHEAAHLVGLNEEQAQAIQRFALANMGLLSPDEGQLKEYLNTSDRLFGAFLEVAGDFRTNNTAPVCTILSSMKTMALSLLKEFKAGDSLIMPSLVVGDRFAAVILIDISSACVKNDVKEARRLFVEHVGSIFNQIAQVRGYANFVADGDEKKMTLISTFHYLDLGVIYEEALMKDRSGSKLSFEDLTCRFKSNSFERDVRGYTHYSNENGELGSMSISVGGVDKFIMLRRMKGQLGYGFAIMSDKVKVTNQVGLEPTDGGNKTMVFANHIIPGVANRLQFDIEANDDKYQVVCDWKRRGAKLDLQYRDRKMVSMNDKKDEELEHFSMNPAGLSLQIRLITKETGKVNESLSFEQVATLSFNGFIVIETTQGDRCVIPNKLYEKKNVDGLKLAKDLRDGKYTKVVCDMIGDRDSQGEVRHAAWAQDFKVN